MHQLTAVVCINNALLELFIGDPEANVPSDESGEGGVEALVERKEALVLGRLQRARKRTLVTALGAVHEPVKDNECA